VAPQHTPTLSDTMVAMIMVVLEAGYGLRIVADQMSTHNVDVPGMHALTTQLPCPTTPVR